MNRQCPAASDGAGLNNGSRIKPAAPCRCEKTTLIAKLKESALFAFIFDHCEVAIETVGGEGLAVHRKTDGSLPT